MRKLALYFIALLLFSCKSKSAYKTIKGVWTSSESPYQIGGRTDTLTFYKKDSFMIRNYVDGKLKGTRNGSYVINIKDKLLTVKFDDLENKSEILEATDSTLISKPLQSNTITKLRRIR
jgi:hypothetical protein